MRSFGMENVILYRKCCDSAVSRVECKNAVLKFSVSGIGACTGFVRTGSEETRMWALKCVGAKHTLRFRVHFLRPSARL